MLFRLFSNSYFIRHFRNNKRTGAKMLLTIVSGIGMRRSAIGQLIFSPVFGNSPRILCESYLGPVSLSLRIGFIPLDSKDWAGCCIELHYGTILGTLSLLLLAVTIMSWELGQTLSLKKSHNAVRHNTLSVSIATKSLSLAWFRKFLDMLDWCPILINILR